MNASNVYGFDIDEDEVQFQWCRGETYDLKETARLTDQNWWNLGCYIFLISNGRSDCRMQSSSTWTAFMEVGLFHNFEPKSSTIVKLMTTKKQNFLGYMGVVLSRKNSEGNNALKYSA